MTPQEMTTPELMTPTSRRGSMENACANDVGSENAARALYRRSVETAKNWKTNTEERVREHPMQSILIAAGIGAAVGWLIGRKR